ncbi:MAG TPA: hypothetical protein VNA14_05185 [Mycobacteriales bacterium]|nr:hypothetical protein [Mycobacteriales bacterium]
MPSRLRALGGLVGTLLLLGALAPQVALAQIVDIPPGSDDLGAADNWTYKLMAALALGAVLLLLATVVGYVVKARGFKANAKRGGSK